MQVEEPFELRKALLQEAVWSFVVRKLALSIGEVVGDKRHIRGDKDGLVTKLTDNSGIFSTKLSLSEERFVYNCSKVLKKTLQEI